MLKHRYNELKLEHGELWLINDFAECREFAYLDEDNEPMLRVYRTSPEAFNLQIRTYSPTTEYGNGKPRNMIATIPLRLKDVEEILRYMKGGFGHENEAK